MRMAGISIRTDDNHVHAAFHSLRHLFTHDAGAFTDIVHALRYDRIEAHLRAPAGSSPRRSSGKKGERSMFEGERSFSARERGKNSGARATSAVSPAKS